MPETAFHTTFSTSHFWLSRAKNGSESGLRSAVSYRFGFNGKENDNEVKGTGNSVDFGARIYDSRLGRWLSVDPLQVKYPDYSPYNLCLNNPIVFIDPNGKEIKVMITNNKGETSCILWRPGTPITTDMDINSQKALLALEFLASGEGGEKAQEMLNYLVNSPDILQIEANIENAAGYGYGGLDYDFTRILFVSSSGQYQASVCGFAHELNHAFDHFKLKEALRNAKAKKDDKEYFEDNKSIVRKEIRASRRHLRQFNWSGKNSAVFDQVEQQAVFMENSVADALNGKITNEYDLNGKRQYYGDQSGAGQTSGSIFSTEEGSFTAFMNIINRSKK